MPDPGPAHSLDRGRPRRGPRPRSAIPSQVLEHEPGRQVDVADAYNYDDLVVAYVTNRPAIVEAADRAMIALKMLASSCPRSRRSGSSSRQARCLYLDLEDRPLPAVPSVPVTTATRSSSSWRSNPTTTRRSPSPSDSPRARILRALNHTAAGG